MSDLIKRLRKIAKDKAFQHHHINMYAPKDKTTRKDFIEWEAADEIERLRAALDEIESYGGAQGLIAREALRDE